jgi:hypothetical protein
MIRIQLWKGDVQIGRDQDVSPPDSETGVAEAADRVIDQLITDVHRGVHGRGAFRIEADNIDERRVFVGSYYATDVRFPQQKEHAA